MLERQKYELLRSELKNTRLAASLRQIDLAKLLKKPQSYVSKIESGERNLDVIEFVSYCDALGIDPSKWLRRMIDKFN
ncbi:helix-turn-helix transcriptional regulator [Polynucleobacter paneuropaeus]|nr:helix-turn-helix transcriptional regulator [Polynucleobacter paneuropaeus]